MVFTYEGTVLNSTSSSSNNIYTIGAPQCGPFSRHPSVHYVCLVYLPFISTFGIVVNAFVIYLLTAGDGASSQQHKLLDKTQYVYVLGSAITNLCIAGGCNFLSWASNHLTPCLYLGVTPCFIFNLFNFAGGYQMIINVCLICWDRWRIVCLGAYYTHANEVRRARRLLVGTSIVSVALFVVPELIATWTVGLNIPSDFVRCRAMQEQTIPRLWNITLGNYMSWSMIVIPGVIIVTLVSATVWRLWIGKKVAPQTAAQLSASTMTTNATHTNKKMVRASLIMFGTVGALLITYGPLAVGLVLFEYNMIGFVTVEVLVYIQFSHPAVDPFAYALTLPKLRLRARESLLAKATMRLWSTFTAPVSIIPVAYTVTAANKPRS